MYPSLVLSAALMTPAAPVPRDTVPNTTGPAPRVLALKADASGTVRVTGNMPVKVTVTNTYFTIETVVENGQKIQKQVQKQVDQDIVTQQYVNKALADFNGKFTTADGKPLTADEATSRVKNGATVLASADGKPVSKAWLKSVSPDTIVMVADGLSNMQAQFGGGDVMPSTPMPALTMLWTDDAGKLMAPCTSAPINANYGYYDDIMWEGRGFGGRRVIRNIDYIDYGYGQQYNGKVVNKQLADVKFDAYDTTGKLMTKNEALKRLAAGGMVLVAGDNRLPDSAYLKGFHQEVVVLVSPELVLPVVPTDQTKKKEQTKDAPKDQPKDAPAVPLPAIQPGIIIKGK